jgi:hypothetical protein
MEKDGGDKKGIKSREEKKIPGATRDQVID